MGKFYLNKIPKGKRIKLIAEFYDAVNCLKNRDEIRLFFRDLLSPDEIAMLSRRIEVALLLKAGFTYREIGEALGVGADKILNVQRSLNVHGEGYDLVLKRLRKVLRKREKKKEKIIKEKTSLSPLAELKRRYPGYFLLVNLFDALDDWLDDDGKLNIEREIERKRKIRKQRTKKAKKR
jgi:TrpR-related protein YerC/YecD